ncbi:MAG TPA: AI-2E family transporter [Candidatus Limnocylindrales bacterium]|nr:AI-2E family transporter [Candidatus Limnocylindrales bacterium]
MVRTHPRGASQRVSPLLSIVIIIAVLYFAKEVLIPIALAILLSFLLTPLVVRLERWRFPHIPAVLIVVILSFMVIGTLTWIVTNQIVNLANRLPEYRENIKRKVEALKQPSTGSLGKATESIKELSEEISSELEKAQKSKPKEQPYPLFSPVPNNTRPEQPIPVRIVPPPLNPLEYLRDLLSPLFAPLGTAAIVIVFTIFMLIQRQDLRDRFIHLIGQGRLNVTTQAIDDASSRVSRYLLMQLVVNTTYGIPIGIGLYFIGIPNAILWGLLAIVLRFIPFVGPWIAASMPLVLSLAISDNWAPAFWTIGLFIIVELISNNVIEPWLYGASTGLSTIAILVAAVFWTWLWGTVGLLLATPLTVCIAVIGRYVPNLEFLNVLLSDEPVLTPEARFYQRLLALDQAEATEVAEEYLKEKPLEALYDEVLVPALIMVEQDRHEGDLDEAREKFIFESTRELIQELNEQFDHQAVIPTKPNDNIEDSVERVLASPGSKICVIPARDEADQITSMMLAQLLRRNGYPVEVLSAALLTGELLEQISKQRPDIICISALPPSTVAHASYLCKRLRNRFPEVKILVGLWHAKGDIEKAKARLRGAQADQVVTTLSEAIEQIRQLNESILLAKQKPSVLPDADPMKSIPAPLSTGEEKTSSTSPSNEKEQPDNPNRPNSSDPIKEENPLNQYNFLPLPAIQQYLLPTGPQEGPTYATYHICQPLSEVGGYIADIKVRENGSVVLFLADVVDQSPSAVLLATMVKTLFFQALPSLTKPQEFFTTINRDLKPMAQPGQFVSAMVALFNPNLKKLELGCAGSPGSVLLRGSSTEFIQLPQEPPLFSEPDHVYQPSTSLNLLPGDRLVFYTEGTVEVMNKGGELLGNKGIIQLIKNASYLKGPDFLKEVLQGILNYSGNQLSDDILIMSLEYRGDEIEQPLSVTETLDLREVQDGVKINPTPGLREKIQINLPGGQS